MKNQKEIARKKAELIANGKIYISNDIKLPYPLERSTAGPGSGSHSITLNFQDKNIKLEVSKNQKELFSLNKENDNYYIKKNDEIFLKNIKTVPVFLHAPKQAFINLDNRCIYNCAFCNLSEDKFLQNYDKDKFVDLIIRTVKQGKIESIALTSGVYPDNTEIINLMCEIIKDLKNKLEYLPIGVEPCVFDKNEIIQLKNAGADEIKINLQIPDKNLFEKICPGFNFDNTLDMLEEAVKIFGKGKVTSNIIYGLSETDESVINSIEKLASIGIVPTLRKIRINNENQKKLEKAVNRKIPYTSPDRILFLANKQKQILENYNLTTKTFKTMCHKCGCCDIVPFWDI